jgi:hypothetical protein
VATDKRRTSQSRSSKVEETKQTSIRVTQQPTTKSGFGDFYNNVKTFERPDAEIPAPVDLLKLRSGK